jgi:hypothetical protein
MKLPAIRGRNSLIPTHAWADIEEFYARSSQESGRGVEMAELVHHIRSTEYAGRLFDFTSHHELIIGLHPELERHVETLHVAYDGNEEVYRLKYFATPTREPEVVRSYAKADGLEKFDDFIGRLKW